MLPSPTWPNGKGRAPPRRPPAPGHPPPAPYASPPRRASGRWGASPSGSRAVSVREVVPVPEACFGPRLGRSGDRVRRRSVTPLPWPAAPSWLHPQLRLPLRHHAQHHPVRAREVGLDRALHGRGPHATVAVEIFKEAARSANEIVVEHHPLP